MRPSLPDACLLRGASEEESRVLCVLLDCLSVNTCARMIHSSFRL
jgi:hypothetical protein